VVFAAGRDDPCVANTTSASPSATIPTLQDATLVDAFEEITELPTNASRP